MICNKVQFYKKCQFDLKISNFYISNRDGESYELQLCRIVRETRKVIQINVVMLDQIICDPLHHFQSL